MAQHLTDNNIKTIGGQSLLGSGNIPVSGSVGVESIVINGDEILPDEDKKISFNVPIIEDFDANSDNAFSALSFSQVFLKSNDDIVEESLNSSLTVGALRPDNTLDETKTNWLTIINHPIPRASILHYKGVSGQNAPYVLFLDSSRNIITQYQTNLSSVFDATYTVPLGAYYVSVMTRNLEGDVHDIRVDAATGYVPLIKKETIENINPSLDISYCAIGDSLTYNSNSNPDGYTSLLSNYFGFNTTTVNGYSGKSLAESSQGSLLANKASWTSHDLFSLLTCTNDFKLNTDIGVMDDYINNTGRTTFYGALREFIDRVYELNDSAKIVLIGTGQRDNAGYTSWSTNSANHKLRDYIEALKTVANYESLPFVDLFNEANINMRNVSLYTTDGLHYNALGYKAITPSIIQGIKKIHIY